MNFNQKTIKTLNSQENSSSLVLNNYIKVFQIINDLHIKHNSLWLSEIENLGFNHLNLKRLQVETVCSIEDGILDDFYLYITHYKNSLTKLYKDLFLMIKRECFPNVHGRIKNDESILLKLHKKRTEQNGKFSINKVLNDLLGFRIIEEDFSLDENLPDIKKFLEQKKTSGEWRVIHKQRENGDYKGYHVYFMGQNTSCFPLNLA